MTTKKLCLSIMLAIAKRRGDALDTVWFVVGPHGIMPTRIPHEIKGVSFKKRLALSCPILNLSEMCTLAQEMLPGIPLQNILALSKPKIGSWRTMASTIEFKNTASETTEMSGIFSVAQDVYERAVVLVAQRHNVSRGEAMQLVDAAIQHKGWELLPLATTQGDVTRTTLGSPDTSGLLVEISGQEIHFP